MLDKCMFLGYTQGCSYGYWFVPNSLEPQNTKIWDEKTHTHPASIKGTYDLGGPLMKNPNIYIHVLTPPWMYSPLHGLAGIPV